MMTKDDLLKMIRNAFTREGKWNAEVLKTYEPGFWQAWINARLRGEDPWIPYARDEYPDIAFDIFVRFAAEAPSLGIPLAACRQGAADFLVSLSWDASAGEPADLLKNALYLAGKLRARTPEAIALLRDLLTQEKLLARDDWPLELHRGALYALGAMQQRGHREDAALWRKWLQPWDGAGAQHRYVFLPAAFAGLAMCHAEVPTDELRQLLALYDQAQGGDTQMKITPAILALWVDRESESDVVREELWQAVKGSGTPQENWAIVQKCADRAWPCIQDYEAMVRLLEVQPPSPPKIAVSLWAVHSLCGARAVQHVCL